MRKSSLLPRCSHLGTRAPLSLAFHKQLNFQGKTNDRFSLTDENFDEKKVFAGMLGRKFMTGIANYHIYKTEIHYFYDDYSGALEHIKEQDKLINSSMSLPQLVRYIFVSFLTHTALYPDMTKKAQVKTRKRLSDNLAQMTAWADNYEGNFRHLQYAMEAEIARLDGEHYAGGHWLGSFATYLVTGAGVNRTGRADQ